MPSGASSTAQLNFGGCFSYAPANVIDEPLIYKSDDFGHTDVQLALDPWSGPT